jgi:hypothetical protein
MRHGVAIPEVVVVRLYAPLLATPPDPTQPLVVSGGTRFGVQRILPRVSVRAEKYLTRIRALCYNGGTTLIVYNGGTTIRGRQMSKYTAYQKRKKDVIEDRIKRYEEIITKLEEENKKLRAENKLLQELRLRNGT